MQTRRQTQPIRQTASAPAEAPSEQEGGAPSLAFMIARIPEMLPGLHRRHIEFVYFYLLKAQR